MIKLGQEVKEKATGFVGIVTIRHMHRSGVTTYFGNQRKPKDFYEDQLEVIPAEPASVERSCYEYVERVRMKRYERITTDVPVGSYGGFLVNNEMRANPNGEWVKYEDIEMVLQRCNDTADTTSTL